MATAEVLDLMLIGSAELKTLSLNQLLLTEGLVGALIGQPWSWRRGWIPEGQWVCMGEASWERTLSGKIVDIHDGLLYNCRASLLYKKVLICDLFGTLPATNRCV